MHGEVQVHYDYVKKRAALMFPQEKRLYFSEIKDDVDFVTSCSLYDDLIV